MFTHFILEVRINVDDDKNLEKEDKNEKEKKKISEINETLKLGKIKQNNFFFFVCFSLIAMDIKKGY